MNVEIVVDASKAARDLDDIQKRQIPFAQANAINALALDVQAAARVRMRSIFTLRRPQFADRSVKITHFATKRELFATIGIHPPGSLGDQRADIFTKFEDQTEKTPHAGRTLAIPVSQRIKRGNAGIISKRDRPAGYNFRQVGNTVRGDRGTFIVRKPDGSGLILQRVKGKGIKRRSYEFKGRKHTGRRTAGNVFALYLLVRRARIKPTLKFESGAEQVATKYWPRRMDTALTAALATAR